MKWILIIAMAGLLAGPASAQKLPKYFIDFQGGGHYFLASEHLDDMESLGFDADEMDGGSFSISAVLRPERQRRFYGATFDYYKGITSVTKEGVSLSYSVTVKSFAPSVLLITNSPGSLQGFLRAGVAIASCYREFSAPFPLSWDDSVMLYGARGSIGVQFGTGQLRWTIEVSYLSLPAAIKTDKGDRDFAVGGPMFSTGIRFVGMP